MTIRMLYIARHGDAAPSGDLSDDGRTQAEALGARLAGAGLTAIHHGPLPRAAQTAAIVAKHCPGIPCMADERTGDYPPSGPDWRWLGLNLGNASLTFIRCQDSRPPVLVTFNDMGHLPEPLRWTGFPAALRP